MIDAVFSRCPVGSATEYIMRTGALQRELEENGFRFRLLQEMDPRYQSAHFTQEEPLHFRDGGNTPPIWAQSLGDRSVLLGITRQHERFGIFVRPDSPIRKAADLRGCRFAVPVREDMPVDFQRLTTLRGLENALKGTGVTVEEVTLVSVSCKIRHAVRQSSELTVMKKEFDLFTEELAAVESGLADAAFANSVKAVRLAESGRFRDILSPEQCFDGQALNNNNPVLITCTKRFAYEHPDAVTLYLRTLLRAAAEIGSAPCRFAEAIHEGVYEASLEEFAKAYASDIHLLRSPTLTEEDISMVRKQAENLFRCGVIACIPDIDAWADPSFLKEAHQTPDTGGRMKRRA